MAEQAQTDRKGQKTQHSHCPYPDSPEKPEDSRVTGKGRPQWQKIISHRLNTVLNLLQSEAPNIKLFSSEFTASQNKAQEYVLK